MHRQHMWAVQCHLRRANPVTDDQPIYPVHAVISPTAATKTRLRVRPMHGPDEYLRPSRMQLFPRYLNHRCHMDGSDRLCIECRTCNIRGVFGLRFYARFNLCPHAFNRIRVKAWINQRLAQQIDRLILIFGQKFCRYRQNICIDP